MIENPNIGDTINCYYSKGFVIISEKNYLRLKSKSNHFGILRNLYGLFPIKNCRLILIEKKNEKIFYNNEEDNKDNEEYNLFI